MYVYFQIILQSDRFFTIEGKNYNFSYKVLQNFENVVTNFTTHTELGFPVEYPAKRGGCNAERDYSILGQRKYIQA